MNQQQLVQCVAVKIENLQLPAAMHSTVTVLRPATSVSKALGRNNKSPERGFMAEGGKTCFKDI